MANCIRNFQSLGFPHNFAQKKTRQNPNVGCIDASQCQLQSVIKNYGLKLLFEENMVILIRTIIAGPLTKKKPNFLDPQFV